MVDVYTPPAFEMRRYTARWTSRDGSMNMIVVGHYRIAESNAARFVAGGATDATITTEAYRDGQWVAESVDEIHPEPRAPNA